MNWSQFRKKKTVTYVILGMLVIATPILLFAVNQSTENHSHASTNGSVYSIVVTPKIISDFNNPLPSIKTFFDQNQARMSGYGQKIIAFAVGGGDQIFRYPANTTPPVQTQVLFDDTNFAPYDAYNPSWENNATATLDPTDKISGNYSLKVVASGAGTRQIVKTNYFSIPLRQFPVVKWSWKKLGGQHINIQFYLYNVKTGQGDWIGYAGGSEIIPGMGGGWDRYLIDSTLPTNWTEETANIYQDAERYFDSDQNTHNFESGDWYVNGVSLVAYDGTAWFDNIRFESDGGVNWARKTYTSPMDPSFAEPLNQAGRAYPQDLSYAQIKTIVQTFHDEAARRGMQVQVLDMLESGPELTTQDWKYRMHPEILHTSGDFTNIDITKPLNADTYAYAAYPNGIPQGTLTADFIVNQTSKYVSDMGFDGMYLLNAFGVNSLYHIAQADGYSDTEAGIILNFFKNLKTAMGTKLVMWMDSYYPVSVEHDRLSIPAAAYQYMDIIEDSTFWQNANGDPIVAWDGNQTDLRATVDSHLALKSQYPNLKVLWTFYYLDPWYYQPPGNYSYGGYRERTSYTWWNGPAANYSALMDGITLYTTGYKGNPADQSWLVPLALVTPNVPTPTSAPIRNPIGYVAADCSSLTAWSCDASDFSQPLQIHIYDGNAYSGGRIVEAITADKKTGTATYDNAIASYCGGNPAHQYYGTLPDAFKDGKPHSIFAYGINIGDGNTNTELLPGGPGATTVTCAAPAAAVPTPAPAQIRNPIGFVYASCGYIGGWTCDASDYSQSLQVHLYDGDPAAGGKIVEGITANQKTGNAAQDTAVGNYCGSNPSHQFYLTPPAAFKDGKQHTLYAYAINIGDGNTNTQLALPSANATTFTCPAPTSTSSGPAPLPQPRR